MAVTNSPPRTPVGRAGAAGMMFPQWHEGHPRFSAAGRGEAGGGHSPATRYPRAGPGGIGGSGPPGCRFAPSVGTDGGDGGVILEKNEKCLGFEMHREI